MENAQFEASRCLYCYDAPCQRACPAGINVPGFIRRILEGNIHGAGELIFEENIMGATCARVCPTEELCEGSCVIRSSTGSPVAIARLQRFATDWFFAHKLSLKFKPTNQKPKKRVAIIGAGPAGLSCAYELARYGYTVHIYEANARAGGLATQAIASYKISPSVVNKEIALLKKLGVRFYFNARVGKDVKVTELMEKYDALFLGIGLGEASQLDLPGVELRGIIDALEFLRRVKIQKKFRVGKKVVVIGGGNTALDSAIVARLLGAEQVMVVYRRSPEEMRGYRSELDTARLKECWFYWQAQPVRFIGEKRVEAVECVKTKLGKPDATGRPSPIPIPGSNFQLKADMVLLAVGQHTEKGIFHNLPGLKTTDQGLIKINPATGETSIKGVFAGGDCV
ncbi:NAD(P)-dependent oxidoreductase, partial [Candidatus Sumerlaeota bacterium]|nr:NAD(P)-dependent oxidoreductase [Candidatus Sumerlaeota bacterium]